MREYKITEQEIEEIFKLLKNRSTMGARNVLYHLEELKQDSKERLIIYKEFFDKINGVLMSTGKSSLISKSEIEQVREDTENKLGKVKR